MPESGQNQVLAKTKRDLDKSSSAGSPADTGSRPTQSRPGMPTPTSAATSAAAPALPDLSKLSSTSVLLTPSVDPPRTFSGKVDLVDVAGDGNCLYHCLLELRKESWNWMRNHEWPGDVKDLKGTMACYFVSKYMPVFHSHWNNYIRGQLNNTEGGKDEELAKQYANKIIITPGQWGGDLEIDIAAHLFNVIINKFEMNTPNNDTPTPTLVASFYPNRDCSDCGRTVPKWNLVLLRKPPVETSALHYNYIRPRPPLVSESADSGQAIPPANPPFQRLVRRKPPDTRCSMNEQLGAYNVERNEREARKEEQKRQQQREETKSPCPGCSGELAYVPPTREQQQQIEDDAAFAAAMVEQQRQIENDAALAAAMEKM